MYFSVYLIVALTFTSRFKATLRNRLWQQSIACSTLWIFEYAIWLLTAAWMTFGLPITVITVAYFIKLKQRDLLANFNRLNLELRRQWPIVKRDENRWKMVNFRLVFISKSLDLVRQYDHVSRETRRYNQFLNRIITIVMSGYTAIITYCTYLIFFTNLPMTFKLAYVILFITHCFWLFALIASCGCIANINFTMSHCALRFAFLCRTFNLYSLTDTLKASCLFLIVSLLPKKLKRLE